MRTIILGFFILLSASGLQAQLTEKTVGIGDVFILNEAPGTAYRNLRFPKRNIIIKRGAIADFNKLIGEKLIVESIIKKENDFTQVVLKRKNGKNFFRFFPNITANIEQALADNELRIAKR